MQNRTIHVIVMSLISIFQIFSPVFFVPGGEAFGASVFRVTIFVAAIFTFLRFGLSFCSGLARLFLVVNAMLVFWLFISLSWTNNVGYGLKEIAYFLTIISLSYVMLFFNRDVKSFQITSLIVAIFGIIIVIISIFEINTGIHFFGSSLQDAADLDQSLSYIAQNQAWFTFGNPNDLSVHLAVCCFAASWFLRGRWYSLIYCIPVLYVSDLLGARIVVIALLLFMATVLFLKIFSSVRQVVIAFFGIGVIGALMFLLVLANADRVEALDVSSFVRLQLIRSAIEMAQGTFLLGVGTGGFEGEMWAAGYISGTFGITNPHNGFGRMLAEGGVVGFVLFMLMLFGPLFALRRVHRDLPIAAPIAGAALSLPLLLSVGSDPASSSSLQLAISLLMVGSQLLYGENGSSREK